ncbi:helix-turn-helix domain-containing protein [Spirosoma sp.]|uniref:helix-turn-helix domain-containing protein n=1 Tax=Spirosoma sp. TaxID=1899569 RepID=UPI003B3B5AF3
MKALFEKILVEEQSSLLVRRFQLPYFDAPWHYHPEYELTYIVKGFGHRFVGDHTEPFGAGDLVLLGPNLPHFWRSDEEFYTPESTHQVESIVVQFSDELGKIGLVNLPEANAVRQLLERSRHGISFSSNVRQSMALQMEQLTERSGLSQLLNLVAILDHLATDADACLLASDGYQLSAGAADTERMQRVLEFIMTNFRTDIRVEQIAMIAGMTPAAFCRYFKQRTRKTFVEYVNELRIGYARKLLNSASLSISQIGLECGYNNSSHFHRQFKLHTGMTPLRYQSALNQFNF